MIQVIALVPVGDKYIESKRRLLIRSKEELELTLTTNKTIYQPGEERCVKTQVNGAKGPVVGLQAVGASIYELAGGVDFVREIRRFRFAEVPRNSRLNRGFADGIVRCHKPDQLLADIAFGGVFESQPRLQGHSRRLNEARDRRLKAQINH
jgi:hypothetical protein